jgi:enterochelin esterase-like enzyme
MNSARVLALAAMAAVMTAGVSAFGQATTAPTPGSDAASLLKLPSGPLEKEPPAAPAPAGGRGGAGFIESMARSAVSPEVSADHRITFRLAAPSAKQVQLQGDFTIHSSTTIEMKNDGNGVWSYTTEPLKPSTYQYWFIVDGVQTPDPVNTYVRPASGVYKSMVDMPGPGTEFMAIRDVPHGVVSEHTYINKDNGTRRQVEVYTPPGYSKSNQSYPVIYLLHGANDYERGWTQSGRANLIMDNMIAEGKAVPAIIVMPFGHDFTGSLGKQAEINSLRVSLGMAPRAGGTVPSASVGGAGAGGGRGAGRGGPAGAAGPATAPTGAPDAAAAGGGAPGGRRGRGGGAPGAGGPATAPGAAGAPGGFAGGRAGGGGGRGPGGPGGGNFMERDLLTNVIPLIDSEYRTIKDADHRAIMGYSMGGGQASSIGFGHPELFAWVGCYSGGSAGNLGATPEEAEKVNKHYKMIFVGCGDDDTTAFGSARSMDATLTQRGIKHTYVASPGYHHDYQVWRLYLAANVQTLFKD